MDLAASPNQLVYLEIVDFPIRLDECTRVKSNVLIAGRPALYERQLDSYVSTYPTYICRIQRRAAISSKRRPSPASAEIDIEGQTVVVEVSVDIAATFEVRRWNAKVRSIREAAGDRRWYSITWEKPDPDCSRGPFDCINAATIIVER